MKFLQWFLFIATLIFISLIIWLPNQRLVVNSHPLYDEMIVLHRGQTFPYLKLTLSSKEFATNKDCQIKVYPPKLLTFLHKGKWEMCIPAEYHNYSSFINDLSKDELLLFGTIKFKECGKIEISAMPLGAFGYKCGPEFFAMLRGEK